jgi:hypothetical protein
MGTRPVGRPRQRWQEDVTEDLKKVKVKNWKETAKDRRTWKDLAGKAKNQGGLQCQMMMMIRKLLKITSLKGMFLKLFYYRICCALMLK